MPHKPKRAGIITFADFEILRPSLGTIVATSGGYDPIHPGHISCLHESKKYGKTLVAIVNGDSFLRAKKGKPFQDLQTRCLIVSAISGVDFVIPYEVSGDNTVCGALEILRPHIFTKGGDRANAATIPEWDTCEKHNIRIITGVGIEKVWSSSLFLEEWSDHIKKQLS